MNLMKKTTMKRRNRKPIEDIEIDEIPLDDEEEMPLTEEEEAKLRKKKNRPLVGVSYLIVLMFLSMAGYLIYFNVILRDSINTSEYNTKQGSRSESIVRGKIYSSDEQILAETKIDPEGNESRSYPFSNIFAHIVGYASNGKSGVEAVNNYDLTSSHATILDQLKDGTLDSKVEGDSIYLTLNSSLQQVCYDALGYNNGAVVVLEPSTGKILSMVSKPDFDPNTISADWDNLINDSSNSSLFNRAIQGQYPPGSTFKILTTLEYMREHSDYQNFNYDCYGSITEGDVTITCYNGSVHGSEDLEAAFEHSCNGAFAEIGMELDNTKFKKLCEEFQFNTTLPIALPSSESLFRLSSDASYGEQMMTAIGQGDTVVSPLQMALVAATVANKGTMMKPYYIDHIATYDGDAVSTTKPEELKKIMTNEEVSVLSGYMKKVVEEGTASGLSGEGYTAAGKTGSAEYGTEETGKGTHSWFVGYLDAEDPKIAIAVIVEDGGAGSESAVPVAKQIFSSYWYTLQYQ